MNIRKIIRKFELIVERKLSEVSCPQIKVKEMFILYFLLILTKLKWDQKRVLVWLACWEIRAHYFSKFLLQRTTLVTKSLTQAFESIPSGFLSLLLLIRDAHLVLARRVSLSLYNPLSQLKWYVCEAAFLEGDGKNKDISPFTTPVYGN